jgi:hypothetical protein
VTASVPPDREAAEEQANKVLGRWVINSTVRRHMASDVADLICQARKDGRREAASWRDAADRYRDLAVRVIDVHAEVGMDSPEDKALHAKAIEAFRRYLDAIDTDLARRAQPDEKERTDGQ